MSSPVVFTLWLMTTCSQLIVYMDVKDTEQFLFSDLNAKWKSAWTQLYFTDLFSKNRIDFKNKWHVSVLVVAECLEQIQFKKNCVIYSVKTVEQTSSSDAVPPENVILSCTFLYWGVFHRHICQSQVMPRFIVLFSVPAAHKSANTGVAQVNLFCSRYIFTGYLQPVKAWHCWRWLICVCTANSGQQRETNKHCARVCWKKLQLRQFSVTVYNWVQSRSRAAYKSSPLTRSVILPPSITCYELTWAAGCGKLNSQQGCKWTRSHTERQWETNSVFPCR